MFDRRLELRADWSPERYEHPLRPLRILPCAKSAPHANVVERLGVGANERRRMKRAAMVLASEALAVEEPHTALLTRADEELAPAIIDCDRRHVDVEITAPHPVRVRCGEVVDELQLLLRIDLHADDPVAEPSGSRIEHGVAGSEVHTPVRVDCCTAAAPQTAASRNERAGAA